MSELKINDVEVRNNWLTTVGIHVVYSKSSNRLFIYIQKPNNDNIVLPDDYKVIGIDEIEVSKILFNTIKPVPEHVTLRTIEENIPNDHRRWYCQNPY